MTQPKRDQVLPGSIWCVSSLRPEVSLAAHKSYSFPGLDNEALS